jgi:cell division protein FtsA
MNEEIIGLDIGTSKICAAVCEISETGELALKSIATGITKGLEKGKVINQDDLQKAIEKTIQKATQNLPQKPSRIITNLPCYGFQFTHNIGFILSKEESGQISEFEKNECIRRASNIFKSTEQKMMHVIPLYYKVDNTIVKNPVGAFGNNLEVQSHLILGNVSNINVITSVIKQQNLFINGIVYDSLASAQILLSDHERKTGAVLIDIGSQFTKISVYNNNLLHQAAIIPIGGQTITSDIAICLKTTIPEAERLKILKGSADISSVNPEEKVEVLSENSGQLETDRALLCQIIQARVLELISLIKKELTLPIDNSYQCVLAGGTSSLPHFEELIKKELNLPTRVGLPVDSQHISNNISHASALGLIVYGIKIGAIPYYKKQNSSIFSKIKGLFSKH